LNDSREDIDVDQLIDSINMDNGLCAGVLDFTHGELAALLANFANSANLSSKRPELRSVRKTSLFMYLNASVKYDK
jgi:hypothetical protein